MGIGDQSQFDHFVHLSGIINGYEPQIDEPRRDEMVTGSQTKICLTAEPVSSV